MWNCFRKQFFNTNKWEENQKLNSDFQLVKFQSYNMGEIKHP